jgi:tetratricopeptide (TPR) repeat protein
MLRILAHAFGRPSRRTAPHASGRSSLRAQGAWILLALAACTSETDIGAVQRGDHYFAADSLAQALAEYRLAVRQEGEEPDLLARVAHTYARLGRVDPAAEFYERAAARDLRWADQGAVDLMRIAEDAARTGDRFLMATAVSRALELRPGLGLGDMALPLARHFFRNGEYGPALPLYQQVLAGNDTTPDILFEVGQAHQEIGDCAQALFFFERFGEAAPRRERSRADWYIGTCSFEVARELRARADRAPEPDPALLDEALQLVDRTIEVGEPRNIQGLAWFERGEILAVLGDCDGALEAFNRVRAVELSSNSAVATRALERIDLLRFGRGLNRLRSDGSCY